MTAALHIRLFGGLYVGQEDVPLTGFVSNKVTALLAYLVVTGRAHQRDTLAALLWGEMTDADAKNNLRQALSNLRKVIDPHLIITRETVEWNPAVPYSLDVQQFTQQLQPGREATTPTIEKPSRRASARNASVSASIATITTSPPMLPHNQQNG